MDNLTFRYSVLLVEGLQITHQSSQLTFIFLLIAYVFAMVSNIGILIQISAEKKFTPAYAHSFLSLASE